MKRIHVLAVASLFGIAAVLGVLAATRTAGVGAQARARSSSSSVVAARTRQLNRLERALRHSLRQRPPALPPVPKLSALAAPLRPRAAPRIVYQRPAPIVIVHHTSHRDDGGDTQAEGGDGGGD